MTQQQTKHRPEWVKIYPFGIDDTYVYWISGIYKIVSYGKGQYHAYFIPEFFDTWGNHVASPPDEGKNGKCWKSLESAKQACVLHSATYNPSNKISRRAEEIKASLVIQAQNYLKETA